MKTNKPSSVCNPVKALSDVNSARRTDPNMNGITRKQQLVTVRSWKLDLSSQISDIQSFCTATIPADTRNGSFFHRNWSSVITVTQDVLQPAEKISHYANRVDHVRCVCALRCWGGIFCWPHKITSHRMTIYLRAFTVHTAHDTCLSPLHVSNKKHFTKACLMSCSYYCMSILRRSMSHLSISN